MKKLLSLALVLFGFNAFADSSVGCGLGSMIFKDNTLLSSTLRVTTNQVFLTQYLGVTSGTSGCSRHDIVMNEKAHIHFAEVNLEKIEQDMIKGQGDYVSVLAYTLGCQDSVINQFNVFTKNNYEKIFNSSETNAGQMLKNLGHEMRSNKSLSKNCIKANLI